VIRCKRLHSYPLEYRAAAEIDKKRSVQSLPFAGVIEAFPLLEMEPARSTHRSPMFFTPRAVRTELDLVSSPITSMV
jgi:hypothetical protein